MDCSLHQICGLPAEHRKRFCILHLRDPGKDSESFRRGLDDHVKRHGWNCGSFYFPASLAPEIKEFSGPVCFDNAEFLSDTDFSTATFKSSVSFRDCLFHGTTRFDGAAFQDSATFESSKFFLDSTWTKAVFSGNADFSFADFAGRLTDFGETTFLLCIIFSNTAFGTTESPDPDPASTGTNQGVFFNHAVFKSETRFDLAKFRVGPDFNSAEFIGPVDFLNASLTETAKFPGTKFVSELKFESVKFEHDAGVDFTRSRFLGRAVIKLPPKPAIRIDFTDAFFSKSADISFVQMDMTWVRLLNTDVRGIHLIGVTWPRIRSDGLLRRLLCSQLRRAGLHRLERCVCLGRHATRDEIEAFRYPEDDPHESRLGATPDENRLSALEALYRGLKINYEEHRHHSMSGDFHFGEKEMRCRNRRLSLQHWCMLKLYRSLSGYSEWYGRPLLISLLIWATASAIYVWASGPPPGSFGSASARRSSIGLPSGLPLTAATNHVARSNKARCNLLNRSPEQYSQGALFSIQGMSRIGPSPIGPITLQYTYAAISTLGPFCFGLFAIALINRLKR